MRRTLLSLIIATIVVLLAQPAGALDDVDWTVTPPESGEVVGAEVVIEGPGNHRLLTIDVPGVEGNTYAVSGTVRYESIEGSGYLEMWSYFGDEAYFSRTLAVNGPMGALTGSSAARDFQLPFSIAGPARPDQIEINIVLPGRGTIWVGGLILDGFGPDTSWWSAGVSNTLGAVLGTVAGLSAGLIAYLAGKQHKQRLAERALMAWIAVGAMTMIGGLVALATSQPQHIWSTLVLLSLILTGVYAAVLTSIRRNHAAAELQRMRALDA